MWWTVSPKSPQSISSPLWTPLCALFLVSLVSFSPWLLFLVFFQFIYMDTFKIGVYSPLANPNISASGIQTKLKSPDRHCYPNSHNCHVSIPISACAFLCLYLYIENYITPFHNFFVLNVLFSPKIKSQRLHHISTKLFDSTAFFFPMVQMYHRLAMTLK